MIKHYETIKEIMFIYNKKYWIAEYDILTKEFLWHDEHNILENNYNLTKDEKIHLEKLYYNFVKTTVEFKLYDN